MEALLLNGTLLEQQKNTDVKAKKTTTKMERDAKQKV